MIDTSEAPGSPVLVTKVTQVLPTLPETPVQVTLPPRKAPGQVIVRTGTPPPVTAALAPSTPTTSTKTPVTAQATSTSTATTTAPATTAPTTAAAAQAQILSAANVQQLQQALNNWTFNYYDPTKVLDVNATKAPIAKLLGTPPITTQEDNCQLFLGANYTDVTILNADKTCYTFVVHIPGTRMLKVSYRLGSGALFGGLGGSSINSYALTLTGEHNPGVKFPSVITFSL